MCPILDKRDNRLKETKRYREEGRKRESGKEGVQNGTRSATVWLELFTERCVRDDNMLGFSVC